VPDLADPTDGLHICLVEREIRLIGEGRAGTRATGEGRVSDLVLCLAQRHAAVRIAAKAPIRKEDPHRNGPARRTRVDPSLQCRVYRRGKCRGAAKYGKNKEEDQDHRSSGLEPQ
jgi:hypothetical protein